MKKRWVTLAALIVGLSGRNAHSQESDNMVYNPSFESYIHCPMHIDAMGVLRDILSFDWVHFFIYFDDNLLHFFRFIVR